jgi:hypothetical protein
MAAILIRNPAAIDGYQVWYALRTADGWRFIKKVTGMAENHGASAGYYTYDAATMKAFSALRTKAVRRIAELHDGWPGPKAAGR